MSGAVKTAHGLFLALVNLVTYRHVQKKGFKIRDKGKPQNVAFTMVYWLGVFTRRRYKDIMVESLRTANKISFPCALGSLLSVRS